MIINNDISEIAKGIKTYFETYVKTYLPYRDNPVFKAILDVIINNYCTELYVDVPSKLLNLVVKNLIDSDTIDGFLVEIGLPEEVINKLTVIEKWVFLEVFADFTRYKSTIQFFRMLGDVTTNNFPEKFDLYELWIDRNNDGTWVLKPKLIYKNRDIDFDIDPIPYDTVYNKVPSLLVSSSQLEQWWEQRKLVLPLKSNLILVVQSEVIEADIAKNILRASFLKTFGNFDINLYFSDKKFIVSLEFIDQLWYYLLCRYYNYTQYDNDFGRVILFNSRSAVVPDISQIRHIFEEYSSIQSWVEYDAFYQQYLRPFLTDYNQQYYTHGDFHDDLYGIQPYIIEYIDNRLSNAANEKEEILVILDEIYGSLLLSITNYSYNSYYQEYLPIYLESLSKVFISIDISSTSVKPEVFTTKILLNLKPYHTEVVFKSYHAVKTKDHEYFDDYNDGFLFEANFASIMSLSLQCFTKFKYAVSDSLQLVSTSGLVDYIHLSNLLIDLIELFRTAFLGLCGTCINISDDYYVNYSGIDLANTLSLLSVFLLNTNLLVDLNYSVSEKLLKLLTTIFSSYISISDHRRSSYIAYQSHSSMDSISRVTRFSTSRTSKSSFTMDDSQFAITIS